MPQCAVPAFTPVTPAADTFTAEAPFLPDFFDQCGSQFPVFYDGTYKHDGTILYGDGAPLSCVVTPVFTPNTCP